MATKEREGLGSDNAGMHRQAFLDRRLLAWLCAVWTPTFTEFLHEFVSSDEAQRCRRQIEHKIDPQGDLPVGAVIQAAIRQGILVDGVTFPAGTYIDIGTPGDLGKGASDVSLNQ